MNEEKMNQTIEDISDSGMGTAFLIHVLNEVTETARTKGMLAGFVIGVSISTVIFIAISIL